MLFSSVFTALYALICVFLYNYAIDREYLKPKLKLFPFFAAAALVLRLYLAYVNPGHKTDMSCFSAWADMLYKDGFAAFYSSDAFTDYPPGYMYILRLVGWAKSLYPYTAGQTNVIIKAPAVLCDIAMGTIVYNEAKKYTPFEKAQLLGIMYLFNPAAIIDSAVWGQVDSVYLLPLALALIFAADQKVFPSCIAFALAILFKPQAIIFTPVFLFVSFDYIKSSDNVKTAWVKIISGLAAAALVFFGAVAPFGIKETFSQYADTLGSYSYTTVNAFNIWGFLGLNWHELNLSITILGYIFIPIVCVMSAFIYFNGDDKTKVFSSSAFLGFAVYMLTVKMHERYAFCTIALMLLACCRSQSRKSFISFILLTLSQMINISWIYFVYEKNSSLYYKSAFVNIASAVNLLILIYIFVMLLKTSDSTALMPKINGWKKRNEKSKKKLSATDLALIIAITAVYSAVAIYSLGDRQAPQTQYLLEPGNQISLSFDKEYTFSELCLFNGNVPIDKNNKLTINFYGSDYTLAETKELSECKVFAWSFEDTENLPKAQHITISAEKETFLREAAFFDPDKNPIIPSGGTAEELFDESSLIPERATNLNGTYFDEIYHARTAYEFLNGIKVYEWTHPPLGKIFIALGIKIFGMNPFGWRIAGTFFGILMLPFFYVFSKRLFKKTWLSAVVTIAFAFDFMHFVQTRIATIDVYITFFVILMYFFMYEYYSLSFYDVPLKKTFVPLLFSGICFGLGTASKWTGIYAGAGLCVLFFMTMHKRYKEYLFAKENPESEKSSEILESFTKNLTYTLAFCIAAFIVIPIIIYLLSYIPYVKCDGGGLKVILKNQTDMYVYHSKTVLDSTHPYSSKWYEWIIMKRPIWYYSGKVTDTIKEGISAFGNPLVWWTGIPAVIYTIYKAVKYKDSNAIFLVTGYFAQLIPWIFVDRVVFIYHYFPCVPFLVLCIGYSISELYKRSEKTKYAAIVYAAAVIGMFLMFYPVLSGMSVNSAMVDKYLRWFSSWVLI